MAIVNPQLVLVDRGQAVTITVTLTSASDLSSKAVTAVLRPYNGGTALATKTVGDGITASHSGTTQTWVITFTATDTGQTPGGYVWDFRQTDSGEQYQIVEPSAFVIRHDAASGGPVITNLSEYVTHSLGGATLTDAQGKQLTQLLFRAEGFIRRWTGRDFYYRSSVTEYYDGTGTPDLPLRRTPIAVSGGITSVHLDHSGGAGTISDSFGADTELTAGEDFYLEPDSLWADGLSHAGILKRIDGVWPLRSRRPFGRLAAGLEPLPGCIKVVYAAGYQLMPYELKGAVWDLTTFLDQTSALGRVPLSESGEGYSRSFGAWEQDAKMIGSVQTVLGMFQRLYPG